MFHADSPEADTTVKPTSESPAIAGRLSGDEAILHHVVRLVPGFLIAVAVVQWVMNNLPLVAKPGYEVDFTIYYSAALALNANPHANIYDLGLLRSVAVAHHLPHLPQYPYLYPPFLALVLRPLTGMPLLQAETVWNELCLLFWLASALLIVYWLRVGLAGHGRVALAPIQRLWSPQWRDRLMPATLTLFAVALGVFVALTYQPLLHAMLLGQVSIFVFLLLLTVPWLMRRRMPEVAGVVLALATMLKLFPILLIGYFIIRGQWRVALGAALGFAGMGITLVVAGVPIRPAIHAILHNGSAQELFYNNQALSRVPVWIEAFGGTKPGPTPDTAATFIGNGLIAVVAAIFVGTVLWIAWRELPWRIRRPDGRAHDGVDRSITDMLGYSWAICTMLLVAPIMWEHYQPWELAPLVFCFGYTVREVAAGRLPVGKPRRALVIISVLIAGYVVSMNALPFNYDSLNTFSVGPIFLGIPLRPVFMLLRPLSAVLVWLVSGYLFLTASRVRPVAADSPAYPSRTSETVPA